MEAKEILKKKRVTGLLFVLPSFLGIFVFIIAPFFMSLYYSFTQGITEVTFVGFDNFLDLFGNPTFTLAVKNTVIFIGIGVPLLFLISLSLSLMMMNSKFVLARWALLTPLMVPVSTVIFGWHFLFHRVTNGILGKLGLKAINFFGGRYAMAVVILMFLWKNIGYLVVIFTSAISVIPQEYQEVFRLESKSRVKYAAMVVLPLIKPMAFFAIIISVMNSFKIFREIHALYGEQVPKSIYMLQHFMNNNFLKLNYQRLSSAAFLLTSAIFVLIWLFLKAQSKSMSEV